MNTDHLQTAANEARGLAIDAINKCSSGHLGLPLGCAELGAVLFSEILRCNPAEPRWLNRDRFVLSAGHGSMFLYAWLHLSGYEVSLDDIKNFRVLNSATPGHPEFGHTPGVEATTGPLGQGIGNSVGYAISQKMLAANFNTTDEEIFDAHVFCLAGDGCMQEGIAMEAVALAGHLALDNLTLIYDSNDVTLDAMAKLTQGEDTAKRFEAIGWEVQTIDGHNLEEIAAALKKSRTANGKPNLIILRTEIGRGIDEVAGTAAAHGEGGIKFAAAAHKKLGLPEETFFVSEQTRDIFLEKKSDREKDYATWQDRFTAWKNNNPKLATKLDDMINRQLPDNLSAIIPEFAEGYSDATRSAGGVVIQHLAEAIPALITGSADLFGSTKNYMKDRGDLSADNHAGRNIWFGIREHAMGAIINGIAYDGFFIPGGATFAVFADYVRPAIRLAALSNLPTHYIFTHDSVAVGEDGPTHQPVETVSALRLIPNLDVIRPGDPEETAGAFVTALKRTDGPTALILSRQKVATLDHLSVAERRGGVTHGAYIALREKADLQLIIIATGSEVGIAIAAARELGDGVRVVSMPSVEIFDRQEKSYRDEILPPACTARIAVEAGVGDLWHRFVGAEGKIISIDRFGLSAPGDQVLNELGISVENIVTNGRKLLG